MLQETTTFNEPAFRAFLDAHLDHDLLRITTAGSVDDGKSTLIGRLLHDTKSVYEDQLAAIAASRVNRTGTGAIDLSLLTDGLRAEREQGITIDVAYRYFSTSRRKFILADTPGHEQYTRNMATGASTADVAIVLIDANAFRKLGQLLPQSRRHTYIASLLRIPHVVAAVNKMDLVDYSESLFAQISADFRALTAQLHLPDITLIPVSALAGDNVVDREVAITPSNGAAPGSSGGDVAFRLRNSTGENGALAPEAGKRNNMPWYTGPTLLDYLETVPATLTSTDAPLRFPIQLVVRPDGNFRGFAGRIESGTLTPGMAVRALPSGRTTRISSIITFDGDLPSASAPRSVTIALEDEIDLSRGDMLIADSRSEPAPHIATTLRAMLVWMHENPLTPGTTYLLKHTTHIVRATVRRILGRIDTATSTTLPAASLAMNDIAEVELDTNHPLFFDTYATHRSLGAFILIDPITNATVAAAMISSTGAAPLESAPAATGQISTPADALSKDRAFRSDISSTPADALSKDHAFSSDISSTPADALSKDHAFSSAIGSHADALSKGHGFSRDIGPTHGTGASAPEAQLFRLSSQAAANLLTQLQTRGHRTILLDDPIVTPANLPAVLHALALAGVLALTTRTDLPSTLIEDPATFLEARP